MKKDSYGQIILDENDLCHFYLQNPESTIKTAVTNTAIKFDSDLDIENIPTLNQYKSTHTSIEQFDKDNQQCWYMPRKYATFNIAEHVLNLCENDEQLQRCGEELLRYAELDMLPLLQYLKYIVDIMRLNNIVWGVGRGSSVSSYVLYKIGVHKIDSLYYGLNYKEFLK